MTRKNDKLQTRVEDAKDKVALEILDDAADSWNEGKMQQSLMLLGGIHTARKIGSAISSEVIRAIAEFGRSGHYKALGFKTFADFLDNSEFSPMGKSAFFEKFKFFSNEGDETFDLLNALNIPVRKRRMLAKGNVEIDGETVIVRDGDNETSIEISDRSRLLETLSALADANADKTRKIEKGEQDFKKLKERVRELEDVADNAGGKLSPGEQLAGNAVNALAGLAAWAESADQAALVSFCYRDLGLFAAQYRRLFDAIENKGLDDAARQSLERSDDDERLAGLLDD